MRRKWLLHTVLVSLIVSLPAAYTYHDVLWFAERPVPYLSDNIALFGLFSLTNIVFYLPFLIGALLFKRVGATRLSKLIYWSGAFAATFFLLMSILSTKFTGNPILYHIPYLIDVVGGFGLKSFEMVGGWQAILKLVSAAALVAVVTLLVAYWPVKKLTATEPSRRSVIIGLSSLYLGLMLTQALWSDLVLPTATLLHLPVKPPYGRQLTALVASRGLRIQSVLPGANGQVALRNFGSTADLNGWKLRSGKSTVELTGELDSEVDRFFAINLKPNTDLVELVDSDGKVRDFVQYTEASKPAASDLPYRGPAVSGLQDSEESLQQAISASMSSPNYELPNINIKAKDHILLVVLESWRADVFNPKDTPKLWARSEKGMRLTNHYSGANATHLGLFALFFARCPILYKVDIEKHNKPAFPAIFSQQGYQTSFLSSESWMGWKWMGRMMNKENFDQTLDIVEVNPNLRVGGWSSWVRRDTAILGGMARQVQSAASPQLLSCKLMATHFPYVFEPDFNLNQPSLHDTGDMSVLQQADSKILMNRYRNASANLDTLLDEMLKQLPMDRTIVVIVGDHGESIWDDGTLSHGSLPSLAQMKTPCIILGDRVPQLTVEEPTYNADLLPTILHILNGAPSELPFSHGESILNQDSKRESVPLIPLSNWPPYRVIFASQDDKIQFNLYAKDWLALRNDLGPSGGGVETTFVGMVNEVGRLLARSPDEKSRTFWTEQLSLWTKTLKN